MGFSPGQASDDEPTRLEMLAADICVAMFGDAISKSIDVLDESRNEAANCLQDLMFAVKHHEWSALDEIDGSNKRALEFHSKQYITLQARYTKNIIAHDKLVEDTKQLAFAIAEKCSTDAKVVSGIKAEDIETLLREKKK